jgi:hypothetical protein
MAKPKKTEAPPTAPVPEKVKATEVKKMISVKKLVSLLADARKSYKEQRSISGELGAMIKDAAEHHALHRGVFGTITKLDRMEPEKLRDWLDNFDYQLEASGLLKRAEAVQPLDLDGFAETDERPDTNVSKFPGPSGLAAE